MSKENHHIHILTAEEIDDYMSKYDCELRYRRYKDWKKYLIIAISTIFCLFQLYSILSGRITAQVLRATHLAFVILLAYLLFPMKKDMPKDKLPFYDIILAVVGAATWSYIVINFDSLVRRAGIYTTLDIFIGMFGVAASLEGYVFRKCLLIERILFIAGGLLLNIPWCVYRYNRFSCYNYFGFDSDIYEK